jgi:flagellar motor switch/type III secretory pathway protein FliN
MMTEQREPLKIPIVLVGGEDVPILYANQFVIQVQQEEFFLTVAQLTPPILLGTEEEQREQARQIEHIPVKVVARLAFTRTRLEELVQLLQGHLERHDRARERRETGRSRREGR